MAGGDAWVFINGKWVLRSKTRGGGTNPTPPAAPAPPSIPGVTPIVPNNPNSLWASYANTLMPFMAPEQQTTLQDMIQRVVPGQYLPPTPPTGEERSVISNGRDILPPAGPPGNKFPDGWVPPASRVSVNRNNLLSSDRAKQALTALENMKASAGTADLGPGYTFLKQALNLLQQYGGTGGINGMSRARYQSFSNAIDNLLSNVSKDENLSDYVSLAGMFLRPTVNGQSLIDRTNIGGRTFFGAPNRKLYS